MWSFIWDNQPFPVGDICSLMICKTLEHNTERKWDRVPSLQELTLHHADNALDASGKLASADSKVLVSLV